MWNIIFSIIILVVSLILIIWGGDVFVNSSVAIAKKLKVPTSIIGATLVSIGTTIPEILVTIFSITSNAGDLAVGNALGSVIFNCCVIGGILLLFTTITLKNSHHFDYIILLFALASIFILGISGNIGTYGSIFLLLLFAIFVGINIFNAKKDTPSLDEQKTRPLWQHFIIFLLASAVIGIGAYLLVEKAKYLAKMIGFDELVIGLTIVAFGTSLPELITTINAIRKKEPGLGLGNIVGSNIINSTLLLGITGTFGGGLYISPQTLLITLPIAIACNIVLLVPTLKRGKTYKWQGFTILGIYALYYIYMVVSSLAI